MNACGDVSLVADGATTEGQSIWYIVLRALEEVRVRAVVDTNKPTDLYTDGSCLDLGKPWAAAGWGVHVWNSDRLGDYYGALPGTIQTNSRSELMAIEAALQLTWTSLHNHFRVFTDCEYAKNDIKLWL